MSQTCHQVNVISTEVSRYDERSGEIPVRQMGRERGHRSQEQGACPS